MEEEPLLIRVHGDPSGPTMIHLPGIHGDWSMVGDFRREAVKHLCFVEFTYPRTTTWSMDQYGQAIYDSLLQHNIKHGWIMAESFGSQLAWKVLEIQRKSPQDFTPEGSILAGGFVQHMTLCGFKFLGFKIKFSIKTQFTILRYTGRRILKRCLRDPLVKEDLMEFKKRRSQLDRDAVKHRLKIIAANDPRPVAAETHIPVYCMGGLIDLAVIFPHTRYWLWRHCPGYKGGYLMLDPDLRVIGSDHHVLGRAKKAFAIMSRWMGLNQS